MPFCPSCRKKVSETDDFCSECGVKVVHKEEKVSTESNKTSISERVRGVEPGEGDSRAGMSPNVKLALSRVLLGEHAEFDVIGLKSEEERLVTATVACNLLFNAAGQKYEQGRRTWRELSKDLGHSPLPYESISLFVPAFEIDVEDERMIREFFDLPIAGNGTCRQIIELFGMQLTDGEAIYRGLNGRLELANAYLDPKRIIVLTMSTRERLNRSWADIEEFCRDLGTSFDDVSRRWFGEYLPGETPIERAHTKFACATRVVLSKDECFYTIGMPKGKEMPKEKEKSKRAWFDRLLSK